jgi:short chain dehydrogenase
VGRHGPRTGRPDRCRDRASRGIGLAVTRALAGAGSAGSAGARIDILVNNVGSAPARPGGFLSITDADWDATITLNLLAAVRTTRDALPAMLAAGARRDHHRLLGERPAA